MAKTEGFTIAQAAETLGVSQMTIRRWIKKGKIKAQLIDGTYGQEYRISKLPSRFPSGSLGKPLNSPLNSSIEFVKTLQERNEYLAARVGYLESELRRAQDQIKLLAAPKSEKILVETTVEEMSQELQALEKVIDALSGVKPRSRAWHLRAVYTLALVLRENGIPLEDARNFADRWARHYRSQDTKAAIKPSRARYEVKTACWRTQDKPSRQWYNLLVGEDPPGNFWVDLPPSPGLAKAVKRAGRRSYMVESQTKEVQG